MFSYYVILYDVTASRPVKASLQLEFLSEHDVLLLARCHHGDLASSFIGGMSKSRILVVVDDMVPTLVFSMDQALQ